MRLEDVLTVGELIRKLKKADPDAMVACSDEDKWVDKEMHVATGCGKWYANNQHGITGDVFEITYMIDDPVDTLTVSDLLKSLQKAPNDFPIVCTADDGDSDRWQCPVFAAYAEDPVFNIDYRVTEVS